MKKNLLVIAAVLSMLLAFCAFGFALLQGVIAYHVNATGLFHGEEYSVHTTLSIGGAALAFSFLCYAFALACARWAVREQNRDPRRVPTYRITPL